MAENVAPRRFLNLPTRKMELPFSDAVLVGGTLHISGRIGLDPKTMWAPADLDQEIRFLLDEFEAVLALADMEWDDLVWVQIFSPDPSLWERFNPAYVKRFTGPLPARAFVGSGALLRGGHFEMMGTAVKR